MWPSPIGVISMADARPLAAAEFPLFARMKVVEIDFCELLVPETGELILPPLTARCAMRGCLCCWRRGSTCSATWPRKIPPPVLWTSTICVSASMSGPHATSRRLGRSAGLSAAWE